MSKGTRIFYMFCVLFIIMMAINMIIFENRGILPIEDMGIFFKWLGINLILSIILIVLWDYASNVMKDSPSILWKVFRGIVVATAWVLTAIIAIFIIFGILLDMDSNGFFNTEFIKIILIIWGIASLTGAIRSVKDS